MTAVDSDPGWVGHRPDLRFGMMGKRLRPTGLTLLWIGADWLPLS